MVESETSGAPNVSFELLRDFEKRSLIHAVGLPEQALEEGSWSGIAYRLADANLVSDIADIVEILPLPPVTPVPGAKSWVLGISNVRGTLVPIVDLRGFLAGEKSNITKYTRVLVVQQQGGVVGLLIDEVSGQRHFVKEEECLEQHFNAHIVGPFIAREYLKRDDEYWGAFSVARLVNNADFMQAAL